MEKAEVFSFPTVTTSPVTIENLPDLPGPHFRAFQFCLIEGILWGIHYIQKQILR